MATTRKHLKKGAKKVRGSGGIPSKTPPRSGKAVTTVTYKTKTGQTKKDYYYDRDKSTKAIIKEFEVVGKGRK